MIYWRGPMSGRCHSREKRDDAKNPHRGRNHSDCIGAVDVRRAECGATELHAVLSEGLPGLTFGPGAPSYSVGMVNGQCYCGVWTNVTPQQAQQQGWYASCNNGKGICNYAPGTRARNQVCGPF